MQFNPRRLFTMTLLYFYVLLGTGCSTSTIYLVRHAEKAATPANDPGLTEAGQQRARALADALLDQNMAVIYTTNTLRTRSTALPLANELGLSIRPYSPDTLWETARYLMKIKEGNVLVVGHSNTILPLLDQFPVSHTQTSIPDSDYDNLYKVVVRKRFLRPDKITLTEGTYGAVSE